MAGISKVVRLVLRVVAGLALLALAAAVGAGALLAVLRSAIARAGLNRVDPASPEIRLVCLADGIRLTSKARPLLGGAVVALAGGAEIDLREATIDPSGARLTLVTVAGGTVVTVPADCEVTLSGRAIAGEHSNVAGDPPAGAGGGPAAVPQLEIDALTIAGGLVIRRAPTGAD